MDSLARPPASLMETLRRHGQEHLLRWWDDLQPDQRRELLDQIESVDLPLIESLLASHRSRDAAGREQGSGVRSQESGISSQGSDSQLSTLNSQLTTHAPLTTHHSPDSFLIPHPRSGTPPAPPSNLVRLPRSPGERSAWSQARSVGETLLAEGRVAALLVAGGQGSRLGFDHAKGMFPIGPVSGAPLYRILAEQVLARSRRARVAIPWYIMTSEATHEETAAMFEAEDYFGLDSSHVRLFRQGNMPVVDAASGRLLMSDRHRLCLAPDGHGGLAAAMAAAGVLDDMRRRGVEFIFYHQVDNPTAVVCDPAFVGFHALHGAEVSTKVAVKRSPGERMGVVVDVDGRTQIIEYSDLPAELAAATDEDGRLLLWAGNTAIHDFDRSFLERLAGEAASLPWHVAHKCVPHIDEAGCLVTPDQPHAFKFERFIFDALPLARKALVVEADRRREFNPVKNAEGEDTPEQVRTAISALYCGWLRAAGARVHRDAVVEISPLFALDEEDLRRRIPPGTVVAGEVCFRPKNPKNR